MVNFVVRLQPRLEGAEQFLPDVRRVADDNIEAALGEDFGEGGRPVEGFGVDVAPGADKNVSAPSRDSRLSRRRSRSVMDGSKMWPRMKRAGGAMLGCGRGRVYNHKWWGGLIED